LNLHGPRCFFLPKYIVQTRPQGAVPYGGLWRLYVFVPEALAARTAEPARRICGYPSEHQADRFSE
jgi:hypothetical protein